MISEDRGETWLSDARHPSCPLTLLPDGSVFGLNLADGQADDRVVRYMREVHSHDHGRSWAERMAGATELWAWNLHTFNPPRLQPDGSMLLLANGAPVEGAPPRGEDQSGFLLERKAGESIWRFKSQLFWARAEYEERPNENSLAVLPSGRLVAVARAGYPDTQMVWAISDDGGASWEEQGQLPWSGVAPCFYELSSGHWALVFGQRRPEKLTGIITGAVLYPDGESWSEEFVIYDGPGSSYHGGLLCAPDTLLITYSSGMFRQSELPQFSADYNRICARTVNLEL
jgi:hypothetical protein